jgi:tol-pal system protein YbgF
MAVMPAMMGCSSSGMHAQVRHASDAQMHDAEITALRVQLDEKEQELRVVRGQLALAQAQVEELEGTARREAAAPASKAGAEGEEVEPPWTREVVADQRLTVTADVPDLPTVEAREPAAEPGPSQVSVDGYRRGLELLRDERFEEALVELEAFLAAHPSHSYADNALFWCGEIHYLRRNYTRALAEFEQLQKLYPWGNKAPDALYRMGQIHLKRGDRARARAYFDKVREQFPDTAAARLALREDAS